MRRAVVFVAIVSTLWLPQAAAAQTTATLTGRVVDDSGGVLPGATITARHTQTGLQRSTVSDAQGRYTLASLTPGSYQVHVELSGFRPLQRT
ncbi:MAG: carboxypeptidase-like regulatory domain-containing protein [Acidobacteriota bacterium]|nr:carboxypeptidase-like regulatory domain-containing protein [Acidobacteriota bacterium]